MTAKCALDQQAIDRMQSATVDGPRAEPVIDLTEAYAARAARELCAAEYMTDFAMRAACERNAEDGWRDFVAIRERYRQDDMMMLALAECYEFHSIAPITDFALAGACARSQEDGYLRTQ